MPENVASFGGDIDSLALTITLVGALLVRPRPSRLLPAGMVGLWPLLYVLVYLV